MKRTTAIFIIVFALCSNLSVYAQQVDEIGAFLEKIKTLEQNNTTAHVTKFEKRANGRVYFVVPYNFTE